MTTARAMPRLVAVAALGCSGCAGARVNVTVDHARYPLSLSSVVRDANGRPYDSHTLIKVGWLDVRKTTPAFVYSAVTIPPTRDFSDEINVQVAAAGGEAVVGLKIWASWGCDWLNFFPVLNILPIWPGCVPVRLTGDIVKRRNMGL